MEAAGQKTSFSHVQLAGRVAYLESCSLQVDFFTTRRTTAEPSPAAGSGGVEEISYLVTIAMQWWVKKFANLNISSATPKSHLFHNYFMVIF